jgi:hypothetical protein
MQTRAQEREAFHQSQLDQVNASLSTITSLLAALQPSTHHSSASSINPPAPHDTEDSS